MSWQLLRPPRLQNNKRTRGDAMTTTILLCGALVMQRVGDLSDELRMLLADHLHVHCDLSDVEAIDAMGLQVLLAARTRQLAKGGTLTFVSVSEPVSEYCAAVGLRLENR